MARSLVAKSVDIENERPSQSIRARGPVCGRSCAPLRNDLRRGEDPTERSGARVITTLGPQIRR